MTEKKKKVFLLSILKAHSQSTPRVKWSWIQTGQRTDTRETDKFNRRVTEFVLIFLFLHLFNTL